MAFRLLLRLAGQFYIASYRLGRCNIGLINRRKFGSQTSENADRWKSRGGKSQRGEEQTREDQRREKVRRRIMKVAIQCVFPTICGSGGLKSRPSARFWKLRCRKSVRRCGAKHFSKSKYIKRTMDHFGCCVAGARNCALCQKRAKS